jgi:hypothetical protein
VRFIGRVDYEHNVVVAIDPFRVVDIRSDRNDRHSFPADCSLRRGCAAAQSDLSTETMPARRVDASAPLTLKATTPPATVSVGSDAAGRLASASDLPIPPEARRLRRGFRQRRGRWPLTGYSAASRFRTRWPAVEPLEPDQRAARRPPAETAGPRVTSRSAAGRRLRARRTSARLQSLKAPMRVAHSRAGSWVNSANFRRTRPGARRRQGRPMTSVPS